MILLIQHDTKYEIYFGLGVRPLKTLLRCTCTKGHIFYESFQEKFDTGRFMGNSWIFPINLPVTKYESNK